MNRWPVQHKILLAVFCICMVVAGAVWLYVLRPFQQRVASQTQAVHDESARIRARGWPVDEGKLIVLRRDKQRQQMQLRERKEQLWNLVDKTFAEKMRKYDGKVELFMNQVTRLDFQEEFAKVCDDLKGPSADRHYMFHVDVLKLSEDSVSPYVYQLMLQLWTLESVMKMAKEHHLVPVLVPVEIPEERAGGEAASGTEASYEVKDYAGVTLQPPRAYFLQPSDSGPYLLECPLRMKVTCQPRDLEEFLRGLDSADRFAPINRLQVRKLPPANGQAESTLEVELECATLFLLRSDVSYVPERKPQVFRPGA